jgi:hypothetical protein
MTRQALASSLPRTPSIGKTYFQSISREILLKIISGEIQSQYRELIKRENWESRAKNEKQENRKKIKREKKMKNEI